MKKLFVTSLAAVALLTTSSIATPAFSYKSKDKAHDAVHSHEDKVHKHVDEKAGLSIVDIAASDSNFSTLVAAVKAAGLADTLATTENITVFAPTNAAFEKLPAGTVEDLLKPENKEKLQSILKYHVVGSKIKSSGINAGETNVSTLQGSDIKVTKNEGGVTINNANVVKADLKASNGVIHVIDTVILPE